MSDLFEYRHVLLLSHQNASCLYTAKQEVVRTFGDFHTAVRLDPVQVLRRDDQFPFVFGVLQIGIVTDRTNV